MIDIFSKENPYHEIWIKNLESWNKLLKRGDEKNSQLRIYTVNWGMMVSWVEVFAETGVKLHEDVGIKAEGSWVNGANDQYIWIRSFDDHEDLEVKIYAFRKSPRWGGGVRELVFSHLARLDSHPMKPV